MGNASSKDRHDDTVDFGTLYPQGIYTGAQDWNKEIVGRAIVERKLAPFYRPLEDYEDSWDDDRILAARKEPQSAVPGQSSDAPAPTAVSHLSRPHTAKSARAVSKEPQRLTEAKAYRGAVECPICFLYYPPNINRSRCCDQAICTECFVQIKRAEPTPTHLVSEPACCPYCVQENFGVVYTPPPWRTGIAAEMATGGRPDLSRPGSSSYSTDSGGPTGAAKQRRKSLSHNSEDVVTIDQIRPDWEEKLAAVKAAVARRANRRIIMRQVGDRLIPVGVTSGRIHAIEDQQENGGEDSSGRRSRRRAPQSAELGQLLQSMGIGMGGQDLEELLLQEAMRLSLIEHEAQQKREAEAKAKQAASGASPTDNNEAGPSAIPGNSTPLVQIATPIRDLSPAPASGGSTRSVSPQPRGHIPINPSPLANATAAIALGVGLPGVASQRDESPGRLEPTDGRGRHSRNSSRSHSRNGSQSTLPYSTLAAAVNAASVASAYVGPSGRSTPLEEQPTESASANRLPPPPLPVLVSPSELFEDTIHAQPKSTNGSSGESSNELPTKVQGIPATAADIPSPGPASQRTGAKSSGVPTPSSVTPLPSQAGPSPAPVALPVSTAESNNNLVEESTPSMAPQTLSGEGDDTSTEGESVAHGEVGALDYKVLPSTPSLQITEPLIPDMSRYANGSNTAA